MNEFVFIGIFFSFNCSYFSNLTSTYYMEIK